MKPIRLSVAIALVTVIFLVWTPLSIASSQIVPFDSDRWEINAKESRVEDYLGRKSLFLKGGDAVVKDSRFTDGIIEFDIAIKPQRGFMGAMWRLQDLKNYEKFYIRAHQSGNPDANQYTPVFNGLAGWQLYYGEKYSTPVDYLFNKWMHVKIIVSGKNAEVYIMDMVNPILFVHELKREVKAGKVGLIAEPTPMLASEAYFSNFSYTSMSNPPLKGRVKKSEVVPGTIMSWLVSEAFDEKTLNNKIRLSKDDKEKLTWNKLACEHSGLANLARIQGSKKGKNSVFAKATIVSEKYQVKQLKFGFSDKIKVYFNDQVIYGGNNTFRTRDYRYLGTIGYFNELYLPLKKGENELWMAISERFGGWGIQARFENMEGIAVK
jgi:hypothetical protein